MLQEEQATLQSCQVLCSLYCHLCMNSCFEYFRNNVYWLHYHVINSCNVIRQLVNYMKLTSRDYYWCNNHRVTTLNADISLYIKELLIQQPHRATNLKTQEHNLHRHWYFYLLVPVIYSLPYALCYSQHVLQLITCSGTRNSEFRGLFQNVGIWTFISSPWSPPC